jgi:hypothetical protein
MDKKDLPKLKELAPSLTQSAGSAKSTADSSRLKALADILKQPAR